jgi:hypothetical protein
MELSITGATDGGAVDGTATIGVRPDERVERVALYVDGRPVSRDGNAPYSLLWDTTVETEGPHELLVYARGHRGRRGAKKFAVVVANAPDFPPSLESDWVDADD